MWKSVGIRFDCIGDEGDEVMIYLSSYAGGPKSQVSFRDKGNAAYPGEGAEARPVNLNEPHELTIRVRGNLINVIVDAKPSVAYRLPVERRPGNLELIAFDATAEFLSFTLSTLPASQAMTDAPGKPAPLFRWIKPNCSSALPKRTLLPPKPSCLLFTLARRLSVRKSKIWGSPVPSI